MKIGRLALYAVCAGMLAGAAHFWGFLPGDSSALSRSAQPGGKKGGAKARSGPAPVTAATVQEAEMPVIVAAPGTVEPLATVGIKTRVDGQIVEVAFSEGDTVEAGSVLFRLDDRLVKAQIAQAEANIARDEASLRDAEATLARRQALIDKRVVTEAALDQARFAVEGLKASIAAGRALLASQKTQLDYLTIRAPITGRTGSLTAKLGATVRSQDAIPLVTINQTRPILAAFSVPQAELAAVRRALESKAVAKVNVRGTHQSVPATISFIDNQVDKQTGTIMVKVVAENEGEVLWPGLAVEVALTVEVRRNMMLVPASAVQPAQQGMIAWIIGPDNKVAPRVVTVDRIIGQNAYLSKGVSVGDRVVTDGQIRLAPGSPVTIEEPRRPASVGEDRSAQGRG